MSLLEDIGRLTAETAELENKQIDLEETSAQLENNQKLIEETEKQIKSTHKEFLDQSEKLSSTNSQLEKSQDELTQTLSAFDKLEVEINKNNTLNDKLINNIEHLRTETSDLENKKAQLDKVSKDLEEGSAELVTKKTEIENKVNQLDQIHSKLEIATDGLSEIEKRISSFQEQESHLKAEVLDLADQKANRDEILDEVKVLIVAGSLPFYQSESMDLNLAGVCERFSGLHGASIVHSADLLLAQNGGTLPLELEPDVIVTIGTPTLSKSFRNYLLDKRPNHYHINASGKGWDTWGSLIKVCLLYTSPSPRDGLISRMPSSA